VGDHAIEPCRVEGHVSVETNQHVASCDVIALTSSLGDSSRLLVAKDMDIGRERSDRKRTAVIDHYDFALLRGRSRTKLIDRPREERCRLVSGGNDEGDHGTSRLRRSRRHREHELALDRPKSGVLNLPRRATAEAPVSLSWSASRIVARS
jgi:hypothetical protein